MLRIKRRSVQASYLGLLVILFSCLFLLTLSHGQASTIATSFRYPIDEGQYWYQGGGYNTHVKRNDKSPCFNNDWIDNNHAGKDFFTNPLALVPVKAVANGVVKNLHQTGGYPGDAILLQHALPDGTVVYSMYGHVKHGSYSLSVGQNVSSGDFLGFVHADGSNTHLHFEIRQYEVPPGQPNCAPIGAGYTAPSVHPDSVGYLNPTKFIDDFNFYSHFSDGVALFSDTHFRGEYKIAHIGFTSLQGSSLDNNSESIVVPPGLTANIYDRADGKLSATEGYAQIRSSTTNLSTVEFTSGENASNGISALFVDIQQCSLPSVSAASAQAATIGSSCNPNPAPAPGSEPLPPYTGSDTTPPRISAFNVTISGAQAFLSVSASDLGGSGIADISYSAKVNGTWRGVATVTQAPFSFTWNLCDAGVPDGDIEFGAVAHDKKGNYYNWSEHFTNPHRTKAHNCASGGGTSPTPVRSCSNLGDWDKSFAYLFDAEGCLGNISWFSAHPADGPGKSGQLSAYVPTGAILKISSDNWNQGEKGCLTGSTQSLASIGWQNKIEWAELVYGGTCAIEQPSRGVTFFSDKNYTGSSWKKTVGFGGGMTDNFNSVRMDDGDMSFVLTNTYGESTCFDKYRFDNLSLQHHSMIDHGDWWDNTVWVFVDNKPCRPLPPYVTDGVQWKGEYPYGTNLTITYRPQRGSGTTLGELTSSSGDKLYLSAPESQTTWVTGPLNPGWYTGYLYSVSDHGLSDRVYLEFTIKDPTCFFLGNNAMLFDGATCTGDSVTLTEDGWYTLQQFDNRTSSIFLPPGKSLEVFDGTNSSDGYATCFEWSKFDLSKDPFYPDSAVADNRITTVRLWSGSSCGRQTPHRICPDISHDFVVLYDYAYCLGEDRIFTEAGFYNLYDFDNRASAIYIPPGQSVRVYSENTKQGYFVCFEGAKWILSLDRFWHTLQTTGNVITSIEVFHTSRCGWPQQPQVYDPENQLFDDSTFSLNWEDIKAEVYWGELWGPGGLFLSSGELSEPRWELSNLPAGQYVWRMRAAVLGQLNDVSEDHYFTVLASGQTLPLTATYSVSTTSPLVVNFVALHCTSDISFTFGDGATSTEMCANGVATAHHTYPQAGIYAALVQDIPVSVVIEPPVQPGCPGKTPPAGTRLFADAECGGDVREFTTPGLYTLADFNDQTAAILLAPGWSVEVFEHSSSSDGHAYCVTRDIWDVSFQSYYATQGITLDGTISNIWLHANSTCGKTFPQYGGCGNNIPLANGIVLFDYLHCGGEEHIFTSTEKKDLSWGTPIDNKTSSVRVAPGWSIKLYTDRGWSGASICIAEDAWELPVPFTNAVSGVEVFHDSVCGVTPAPVVTQLSAPTGLTPARTTITPTQTLILSWQPVPQSFGYQVEFTSSPQYMRSTKVVQPQLVISQPVTGVYTWRVKAIPADTSLKESEWTAGSFVLMEKLPENQPTPLSQRVYLPLITR